MTIIHRQDAAYAQPAALCENGKVWLPPQGSDEELHIHREFVNCEGCLEVHARQQAEIRARRGRPQSDASVLADERYDEPEGILQ